MANGDWMEFAPSPDASARASSPAPTGPPSSGGFDWGKAAGYGLMGLLGGVSGQPIAPMMLMQAMMNRANPQQDPQAIAKLLAAFIARQRPQQQQPQQPQAPSMYPQVAPSPLPPTMDLSGGMPR